MIQWATVLFIFLSKKSLYQAFFRVWGVSYLSLLYLSCAFILRLLVLRHFGFSGMYALYLSSTPREQGEHQTAVCCTAP